MQSRGPEYNVVWHQTSYGLADGNGDEYTRTDTMALRLAGSDIPSVVMRERTRELAGPARMVADGARLMSPYVHRVEVVGREFPNGEDDTISVRLMTLEYTCPDCGETLEADRDHWMLAVPVDLDLKDVLRSLLRRAKSDVLRTPYRPSVCPVRDCRMVPLADLLRRHGPMPTASEPVELLARDIVAGTPSSSWWRSSGCWYAVDEQLVGFYPQEAVYECASCGCLMRAFARFEGQGSRVPFVHHNVLARIVSDAGSIRMSFEPPLGGAVSHVDMNLERGTTQISNEAGEDLFAQARAWPGQDLKDTQYPLGCALASSCDVLYGLATSLMRDHVEGLDRSLAALGPVTRTSFGIAPASGRKGASPLMALAVANRLRGYPLVTYQALSDGCELPCPPEVSCGVLPVRFANDGGSRADGTGVARYSEVTRGVRQAYEESTLPKCKSVRRAILRNPLGLAVVDMAGGPPFRDINVLRTFLNNDWLVARLCRELAERDDTAGYGTRRIFDIICRAKGEPYGLRLLKRSTKWELGDLFCPVDACLADELSQGAPADAIEHATRLEIRSLTKVLVRMAPFCGKRFRDANDSDDLALEDEVDGYSFSLRHSLADLVLSGLVFDGRLTVMGRSHIRLVVVLVFHEDRFVAALEVAPSIGRILFTDDRSNRPVSMNKKLDSAICTWAMRHDLIYSRA